MKFSGHSKCVPLVPLILKPFMTDSTEFIPLSNKFVKRNLVGLYSLQICIGGFMRAWSELYVLSYLIYVCISKIFIKSVVGGPFYVCMRAGRHHQKGLRDDSACVQKCKNRIKSPKSGSITPFALWRRRQGPFKRRRPLPCC